MTTVYLCPVCRKPGRVQTDPHMYRCSMFLCRTTFHREDAGEVLAVEVGDVSKQPPVPGQTFMPGTTTFVLMIRELYDLIRERITLTPGTPEYDTMLEVRTMMGTAGYFLPDLLDKTTKL